MPRSLVEKLVADHLVEGESRAGEEIALRIDQTLTQDATGTLVLRGPAPDARLVVSLRRGGRGRPLVVRNATTLPGLAPGRWAVTARGERSTRGESTVPVTRARGITVRSPRARASPARAASTVP